MSPVLRKLLQTHVQSIQAVVVYVVEGLLFGVHGYILLAAGIIKNVSGLHYPVVMA